MCGGESGLLAKLPCLRKFLPECGVDALDHFFRLLLLRDQAVELLEQFEDLPVGDEVFLFGGGKGGAHPVKVLGTFLVPPGNREAPLRTPNGANPPVESPFRLFRQVIEGAGIAGDGVAGENPPVRDTQDVAGAVGRHLVLAEQLSGAGVVIPEELGIPDQGDEDGLCLLVLVFRIGGDAEPEFHCGFERGQPEGKAELRVRRPRAVDVDGVQEKLVGPLCGLEFLPGEGGGGEFVAELFLEGGDGHLPVVDEFVPGGFALRPEIGETLVGSLECSVSQLRAVRDVPQVVDRGLELFGLVLQALEAGLLLDQDPAEGRFLLAGDLRILQEAFVLFSPEARIFRRHDGLLLFARESGAEGGVLVRGALRLKTKGGNGQGHDRSSDSADP